MGTDKQVRIDLVSDDKASRKIDEVAESVEDLEKADPKIEVTADTGAAEADLAAVKAEADALAQADREIVIRARMADIKGELKELQAELKQTGEQADTTARQLDRVDQPASGGLQTRGNAIADLTGPLGEASGAASDFAGVFDGLGDIVADTAAKMGASQATAGRLSSAVGGLGIAVAAGAAIWSVWKGAAEEAKRKAQELATAQKEINEAIKEGNSLAAGEKLTETYPQAFKSAELLNIELKDMVGFLTGQKDALAGVTSGTEDYSEKQRVAAWVIQSAQKDWEKANGTLADQQRWTDAAATAMGGLTDDTDAAAVATNTLKGKLDLAAGATLGTKRAAEQLGAEWDRLKGKIDDDQAWLNLQDTYDATMEAAGAAFEAAATGAADAEQKARDAQQMLNTYKGEVVDFGKEVAGLPPEKVTEIMALVDQGKLAEAQKQLDDLVKLRTASINVALTGLSLGTQLARALSGLGGGAAGTAVTNVQVNVPRGYQGDVLALGERAARRSGGLYRRNRRR